MTRVRLPFFSWWTSDRGMSLFLIVLVVQVFFIFPLAGLGLLERFAADIVFSLMMIAGAVALERSRILTIVMVMLAVLGVVVHWTSLYIPSFHHPALDAAFLMGLFASFVVLMMMHIFRPGAINLHRVLGAVAAYLSIGITWGFAYFLAAMVNPGAVQFNTPIGQHEIPVARYIYFSFTTLTTIGYGDVIPIHPVARSLAVAEALVGQLYPAILIGGVLGMALQSRVRTER
jgi:voltage-gated potassium channel Kch